VRAALSQFVHTAVVFMRISYHAVYGSGYPCSHWQRRKVIEMIIMSRNKKWSDLTARQKAPFVLPLLLNCL
jgi:hypothetical protein